MLPFYVFAKLQPRSVPPAAPRASTLATDRTVCQLVTSNTPTDVCIPFRFNTFSAYCPRRGPTGSLLSSFLSSPCGHFPSQQGGTPPSPHPHPLPLLQSPRFPAVDPFSLQSLTKCSSHNSFALTTIHFHGGVYTPHFYFPRRPHSIGLLLWPIPLHRCYTPIERP